MRAVVMVLRVRFRQYWKPWLALSLLVAVAGGFVLTTASAGHRTAAAFPEFRARHGYDVIVYSGQRLPRLARLPHVSSVTPVPVTVSADVGCASCRKPIDNDNFLVNEVPPGQLARMVTLLSGRMPRQSDPGEVLASFTLARDNGVRLGSVLWPQLGTQAQLEGGKGKPSPALRPALRVVGIVVTEAEFPSGASPHYDLFATTAYAAAFNQRVALLWTYYVRLAHGDADLADFDGGLRPLGTYGTYDLDEAADAVQASIRPQVIGWYVLTGLAALAALAVIGQAMARQTAAERADHHALSTLGVRPRELRAELSASSVLALRELAPFRVRSRAMDDRRTGRRFRRRLLAVMLAAVAKLRGRPVPDTAMDLVVEDVGLDVRELDPRDPKLLDMELIIVNTATDTVCRAGRHRSCGSRAPPCIRALPRRRRRRS